MFNRPKYTHASPSGLILPEKVSPTCQQTETPLPELFISPEELLHQMTPCVGLQPQIKHRRDSKEQVVSLVMNAEQDILYVVHTRSYGSWIDTQVHEIQSGKRSEIVTIVAVDRRFGGDIIQDPWQNLR